MPRLPWLLTLFLSVALAQPALAQSVPLSPGEVVMVDVYGQPDLSGERQLDEAGQIALPLVGRIDAAGLAAEALEGAIRKKMAESGFEEGAIVTVTVARRLDVYVDGAVSAPGAHPWRPGLTLDQVLALAGGRILVAPDDLGPTLQALRSVEYADGLAQRLRVLTLIQTRLQTERTFLRRAFADPHEEDLDPVALLVLPNGIAADPLLAEMIETQQNLLRHHAFANRRTLASLVARLKTQTERLAALEQRAAALGEVATLIRDRLKAVQTLQDKGLAAGETVVEASRSNAETLAAELDLSAAIAETRVAIEELELERATFVSSLERGIDEELASTGAELADIRARLDPALKAGAVARSFQTGLTRGGTAPPTEASAPDPVVVLRGRGPAQKQLLAVAGFELLPGDTVLVPFAPLD